MELFSDRLGITNPKPLQVTSMDEALKNSIWNFLYEEIIVGPQATEAAKTLAREYLKEPVHQVQRVNSTGWLREKYEKMNWWEVYNLFEFTVCNYPSLRGIGDGRSRESVDWDTFKDQMAKMIKRAVSILEDENSGYRFIDYKLTPISNSTEVAEIDAALKKSSILGFKGVSLHLEKAIEFLSSKP